jgi:membrane protein involved in colicin uptake
LEVGRIGSGSYVPNGLTAAQYQKVRDQEASKKKSNYDRNVKKAGVFEDYTEFYVKRGTDTSQNWKKSVTLGHRMAKTKYDMESENGKKYDGGLLSKLKGKKR